MFKIVVLVVSFLAAILLAPAAAEETDCPEGSHAIYTAEGVLVSCEEIVGSIESCPSDALPGYLEDGTLVGCFTSLLTSEELCPGELDCDGDGFLDVDELFMGTDPQDGCADTPTPNDETGVGDSPWPPDFNDTGATDVGDLVLLRNHWPPLGENYGVRYDLNANGYCDIGDLVILKNHWKPPIGAGADTCTVGGGEVQEESSGYSYSSWCCITLPYELINLHAWGEFRWTIPLPWPLPDLTRTVYRMDLRGTFVWTDVFDMAVGSGKGTAWARWPYSVGDPFVWVEQSSLNRLRLQARTGVCVFPEIAFCPQYHADLWIDFQSGGWYGLGSSGFHREWITEG